MLAEKADVSARPQVVAIARLIADHDTNSLSLVEGGLGGRPFKVHEIQKSNETENQQAENVERLNV